MLKDDHVQSMYMLCADMYVVYISSPTATIAGYKTNSSSNY